ncbi:MAG: DUF4139 domain-containing protein [Candidatus Acidiferrales bacterium]
MISARFRKPIGGALAAAILLVAPFALRIRSAKAAAPDDTPATTRKDQKDLAVTVYNSNLALVRDVRQVTLPEGTFALRFEDVAASINPATVHFRSLTEPAKLNVLEQDYEYDLLDPGKLLQKYVGKEVTLVREVKESGSTKWEETKAVLLADNNGPVWKIGNEIVTGYDANSYRFPELPENLYSRPTLLWTLDNQGPREQKVEASYLTSNVNWSADYVLTVGRDEKAADLDGWVTLVNNSGTAYKNAKLQLVAGEVHRAEGQRQRYEMEMNAAKAAPPPAFAQENLGEYHLYTLDRRTSIEDKESKQISLLNGSNIPIAKSLLVEAEESYYRLQQSIGNPIPQTVKVYYQFKNDEKSGLGMLLPAGTVRVYQADAHGNTQFMGEDAITHTPKDELLHLYVGNAFDVVAERKETDYRRIASNVFEEEFAITIRNHKDAATSVEVREPIGGDWEVLSSDYKWTKLDASTISFQIPVEKDGAATLTYRVRVHW